MGISFVIAGATFTISAAQIASAVVSIAVGFLQLALAKGKGERPQAAVDRRALNELNPSPAYLSAYGSGRLGRNITERRVKGRTMYMQLLVQSRPSAGPWDLYLDDYLIPITGDPFDFAGLGAVSHDPDPVAYPHAGLYAGYVRVWYGLGGQDTIPAALVAEVPELASSPIWPGFSVVWIAVDLGPDGNARDRWPGGQPKVEVEGPMSFLWDPRDPAQDPDDETTWVYSANQALAALDMVRHRYCLAAPDKVNLQSFIDGANIADIQTPIKGGGSEPLYRVAGFWEADGRAAFEMLEPVMLAGMSSITEVDGEWMFIPGRYQPPELALPESVLQSPALTLVSERDPADIFNTARIRFPVPARNWEIQDLPALIDQEVLDDAQGVPSEVTITLEWVPWASQSFRIGWRSIQATRFEREIQGAFKSIAVQAHFGARVSVDLTTIEGEVVEFLCERWALNFEEIDRELGLMRLSVPMSLRETGPAVDVYDPEAQPELDDLITIDPPEPVEPPVIIAVAAAEIAAVISGQATVTQSATASALSYQTRFRQVLGEGVFGAYVQSPEVQVADLVPGEDFTVSFGPLELGDYEVQVRTNSSRGLSIYDVEPFTVGAPDDPPPAPVLVAGATGEDHTVTWRSPDDPRHERLVLWEGGPEFADDAVQVESVATFPNSELINTGSGAVGVDVYYWATSRDVWGNDGPHAGPAVHQTEDPGAGSGDGTGDGDGSGDTGGGGDNNSDGPGDGNSDAGSGSNSDL